MIYLDSAATSFLKPPSVKTEMMNALSTMSSPGRGAYPAAMNAAEKVYECRELVCRLMNFPHPENVVFTMNATHALNIAINTLARAGSRVVISGYEHNSVTRPLHEMGAVIDVAAGRLFDTEDVLRAFSEKIPAADLVICNHVSNVFGFVQPVEKIAKLCKKHKVPFIIDASQSAGIESIDAERLDAAFIAMPGHKGLMGPQGTGVLLCKERPKPLISGGTGSESILQTMPEYLPDAVEAGTHNVVGIAGLCAGIRYVLKTGADTIGRYESSLCAEMADILGRIPALKVYSDSGAQAGVLSVQHESIDCESFCEMLGKNAVAARCGLHCAPLAHKTVGTIDRGTVRLSFSPFISRQQMLRACRIISRIS